MSQSIATGRLSADSSRMGAMTIESIRAEFVRYRTLAERAFAQIPDEQLNSNLGEGTNSVSTLIRHLAGNLKSRYTDFMVSGVDGEKAWRNRDGEFVETRLTRSELLALWKEGNDCFQDVLGRLKPESLAGSVIIRGAELGVDAALHRSLAHYSYHVGQLIMICRIFTGEAKWNALTVLTTDENRGSGVDSEIKW